MRAVNQLTILRYLHDLVYHDLEITAPSSTSPNLTMFSLGVLLYLDLKSLFTLGNVNKYLFREVRKKNPLLAERLINEITISKLKKSNVDVRLGANDKFVYSSLTAGVVSIGWAMLQLSLSSPPIWLWSPPALLGSVALYLGVSGARNSYFEIKNEYSMITKDLLSFMEDKRTKEPLPCTPVQCVIS